MSLNCYSCKFGPRLRCEYPCNRCIDYSLHSDHGFFGEKEIQQRKQQIEKENQKHRVIDRLVVGFLVTAFLYFAVRVIFNFWGNYKMLRTNVFGAQSKWETAKPFSLDDIQRMIDLIKKGGCLCLGNSGMSGEEYQRNLEFSREAHSRKIARLQPYQKDILHVLRSNKTITCKQWRK